MIDKYTSGPNPLHKSKRRRKNSKNKMNGRKLVGMALATVMMANIITPFITDASGIYNWGYVTEQEQYLLDTWATTADADKDTYWHSLSEEEQALIWSFADESGVISPLKEGEKRSIAQDDGVASRAIGNAHSTPAPSWCTCEEETGYRSMTMDIDSLNPTGAPNLRSQGSGYHGDGIIGGVRGTINGNSIFNGNTTPSWSLESGQYIYYGKYENEKVLYRILSTNNTKGFEGGSSRMSHIEHEPILYLDSHEILYQGIYTATVDTSIIQAWDSSLLMSTLQNEMGRSSNVTTLESESLVDITTASVLSYKHTFYSGNNAWDKNDEEVAVKYLALSTEELDGYYGTYEITGGELAKESRVDEIYYWLRTAGYLENSKSYGVWLVGPGFLRAGTTTSATHIGVSPAIALRQSDVAFTHSVVLDKTTFGPTEIVGQSGESNAERRTWSATLNAVPDGGEQFAASRTTSDVINSGDTVAFNVTSLGDTKEGITYNQISVAVQHEDGLVYQYGKVDDAKTGTVEFELAYSGEYNAIPGTYTIYAFAEETNSLSEAHATDYASNMVAIGTYTVEANKYDFRVDTSNHQNMSYVPEDATDPNEEAERISQLQLAPNDEIVELIYQADEWYTFGTDYPGLGTCNGITVERMAGGAQIKVSGTLQDHTTVVLPNPDEGQYKVTFMKVDPDRENEFLEYEVIPFGQNTVVTAPKGPTIGGSNFQYWVRSDMLYIEDNQEYRIKEGEVYKQTPANYSYVPVYGPILGTVVIDVNLNNDTTDYGYEFHKSTVSLYQGTQMVAETEGPDELIDEDNDGYLEHRAVIDYVEEGEYQIWIGGVATGVTVEVKPEVNYDMSLQDVFFYNVTYNYNDKVTPQASYVVLGNQLITEDAIAPDPTVIGNFEGWVYNDKLYPDATSIKLVQVKSPITFTAQYGLEDYSVTYYDINEGEIEGWSRTYQSGSEFTLPEGPLVEGKTFSFWLGSDNKPYSAGSSHTISGDITFSAKYDSNQSTVVFEVNLDDDTWNKHEKQFQLVTASGSSQSSNTEDKILGVVDGTYAIHMNGVSIGKSISLPNDATDGVCTVVLDFYTVTYEFNNGKSPSFDTVEVLKDQVTTAYGTEPTKTGYVFAGWTPLGVRVTAPTTVNATYTASTYAVTFEDGNGNVIKEYTTAEYGSSVMAPVGDDAPTQEGAYLEYWEAKDGSGVYVESPWTHLVTGIITFVPKFTTSTSTVELTIRKDYVEWLGHGKTFALRNSSGVNYVMSTITENTFYNIPSGTYTVIEVNATGNIDTGVSLIVTGSLANVLSPSINYWSVTYLDEVGGNVLLDTQIILNGQNANAYMGTPSKSGYVFSAWSASNYKVTKKLDIVPIWLENPVTITFLDDDGNLIESGYQVPGDWLDQPAETPLKEGYYFTGWNPTCPEMVPDRDSIYTAVFEVDPNYDDGSGNGGSGTVTPPGETVEPGTTTPPVEEPEVEDVKVTITFKYPDGTIIQSGQQTVGNGLNQPTTAPTMSGYYFTGWSPSCPSLVQSSDATYEAVFVKNPTSGSTTGTVTPTVTPGTTTPSTTPPTTSGTTTTTPSTGPTVVLPDTDEDEDELVEEDEGTNTEENSDLLDDDSTTTGGNIVNRVPSGDINTNGIDDGLEDLNGNGILDYLEDWDGDGIPNGSDDKNGNGIPDYLESGYGFDDDCDHFPHFLLMFIIFLLEMAWLYDRRKRQERRYMSAVERLNKDRELYQIEDEILHTEYMTYAQK